jgi:hypothetical protein
MAPLFEESWDILNGITDKIKRERWKRNGSDGI